MRCACSIGCTTNFTALTCVSSPFKAASKRDFRERAFGKWLHGWITINCSGKQQKYAEIQSPTPARLRKGHLKSGPKLSLNSFANIPCSFGQEWSPLSIPTDATDPSTEDFHHGSEHNSPFKYSSTEAKSTMMHTRSAFQKETYPSNPPFSGWYYSVTALHGGPTLQAPLFRSNAENQQQWFSVLKIAKCRKPWPMAQIANIHTLPFAWLFCIFLAKSDPDLIGVSRGDAA